jgi:hypothetical protein
MSSRPIITLLTDFGLADAYVGSMKGVIASLAPEANVIDISHEVPPGDLLRGGMVWAAATPCFPRGTVHVAVIDPEVGGDRRILALQAKGALYLAPDNGLIGYVLERSDIRRAVHVARESCYREPVSPTFHGRDIFAPVAAKLATGLPLDQLGPEVTDCRLSTIPQPERSVRPGCVEERGEVVYIDRFGNATTNLRPLAGLRLEELAVRKTRLGSLRKTYSEVGRGEPLVIVGSTGYLEVAVNEGRAADTLGLAVGGEVLARWGEG